MFAIIMPIILGAVLLFFGFFCYLSFVRKKEREEAMYRAAEEDIESIPQRDGNGNVIVSSMAPIGAPMVHTAERRRLDPAEQRSLLESEFLASKVKDLDSTDGGLCNYCESKVARYVSDCGCELCKEHSKPIRETMEEEQHMKCPVCNKIIHKIQLKKSRCGICLENKKSLAKFKCKCALLVCKECFIRCRTTSDRCPACRAEIS